ncbi:MAG: hypothetical protein R6X33_14495 [Candidatus Brocadiia bacterium]
MALKRARFYPYEQVPVSDTTWSLHAGPDRRIYSSACIEGRGGCAAIIARYDDEADGIEYVYDVGEAGGDPPDSGRATQCKVHYGFAPDARDGVLYAATHASAPALGDFFFNINADWGDERKAFRGSVLIAYDTAEDRVLWGRPFLPHEGCRCLCYDEERRWFYAVGWPRNHFFRYELDTGGLTDYGRLGSINPQAIWLDSHRRAYTTDDYGRIVRFDPDKDRLEELDLRVPRARYMSGWHTIVYDIVASPAEECLYGIPWCNQPHLFRHWPLDGPEGRIEDLGPASQCERDRHHPISFFRDHVGGLVFGPDGMLYYCVARWEPGAVEGARIPRDETTDSITGVVVQMDPATLERRDFAVLDRGDGKPSHYVSRGAMDRNGDLFFGNVGAVPSGIFRLEMDCTEPPDPSRRALRQWG